MLLLLILLGVFGSRDFFLGVRHLFRGKLEEEEAKVRGKETLYCATLKAGSRTARVSDEIIAMSHFQLPIRDRFPAIARHLESNVLSVYVNLTE